MAVKRDEPKQIIQIVYHEQEDMGGKMQGGGDLLWLHVTEECHFLGPSHTEFCDVKLKLIIPWRT